MRSHRKVRGLLYDYARKELSAPEMEEVRRHLQSCRKCSIHLEKLASTVDLLHQTDIRGSTGRPAAYWDGFLRAVEEKTLQQERAEQIQKGHGDRMFLSLLHFRHWWPAYAAGTLVAATLALLIIRPSSPVIQESEHGTGISRAGTADTTDERMTQYLQKSKVLFVGITNMQPDEQGDLSLERKTSRELVREVRALRQRPLDSRSARLLDDTEKILIGVAHMRDQDAAPSVELIRRGIRRDNLLFKIRMAETAYAGRFVRQAAYKE